MKNSTKKLSLVRSVSMWMLITGLILAPGLSNPGFLSYLATGRAYAQTVTTTYTYDNNGSMLSRTTGANADIFTYDTENRLISANMQSGANPGIVTYTYDDNGLRTSATAAGATTLFLLDKNRDNAQVILEKTGNSFVNFTHGHRLISQNRAGQGLRVYLADGQFSTRQLVSPAGLLTDTYTYDAFGELLTSTGTTINNYRYTGEQFDTNSSFYYLRARYYDQATGRFNTTDSFSGRATFPLSLHRYLYADADPVNKIDPSGKFGIVAFAVVALEIIGILAYTGAAGRAVKSFARERAEGITNRFLYKACNQGLFEGWQLGAGAQLGGGNAVIAEQFNVIPKDHTPQARKYSLTYTGLDAGIGIGKDSEGDAIPFSTYKDKKRKLDDFIGEGILTGYPEAKLFLGGNLGSQLQLPEQSVVHQPPSLVAKVGARLSLISTTAVNFVGLDTSSKFSRPTAWPAPTRQTQRRRDK